MSSFPSCSSSSMHRHSVWQRLSTQPGAIWQSLSTRLSSRTSFPAKLRPSRTKGGKGSPIVFQVEPQLGEGVLRLGTSETFQLRAVTGTHGAPEVVKI